MLTALKRIARRIVFGPDKRIPRYVRDKWAKDAMTAQLRREVTEAILIRAVAEAIGQQEVRG